MNAHLCDSVGAARGGFQVGCHQALLDAGVRFVSATGNSVGGTNAAMEATGQHDVCVRIWEGLRDKDVFRGRFGPATTAYRAALNKPTLDLSPLAALMNEHLLDRELLMPLAVQTVDLQKGLQTHSWAAGHKLRAQHLEKIYATTAIPVVFPDNYGADGGIVRPIPLEATMAFCEPGDAVAIVSTHPIRRSNYGPAPKHIVNRLARYYQIQQSHDVVESIEHLLSINRLMEDQGLDEWVDPATQRRHVRIRPLVIAPAKPLELGMLNFAGARHFIDAGRMTAELALERSDWLSLGA